MNFTKKPVESAFSKGMSFDEENGVILVHIEWAPPARMGLTLDYRLTRDEATKLAAAITKWVKAK
jgi:hypothetical protein